MTRVAIAIVSMETRDDVLACLDSLTAERDVEIVVLTDADRSGFERFGFRVERLAGDTPAARAACEDQIRRFWNLDLVL